MAYPHVQYQVQMVGITPSTAPAAGSFGVNLSVTGIQAQLPIMVPHILRMVGMLQNGGNVDAPIAVALDCDITAQGTPTRLLRWTFPTLAANVAKMVYVKPTYLINMPAGSTLTFRVTAAATGTAVRGQVVLFLEPHWEAASNASGLVAATGTLTGSA